MDRSMVCFVASQFHFKFSFDLLTSSGTSGSGSGLFSHICYF